MRLDHFGDYLKQGRQARGLSLVHVSRVTRIKTSTLESLEAGRLDQLPARVFVSGFVAAYAREVGLDASEAMARFRRHVERDEQSAAPSPEENLAAITAGDPGGKGESASGRRPAVTVVVLLILIVATVTLSLLLRDAPAPGRGLSRAPERGAAPNAIPVQAGPAEAGLRGRSA